MQDNLNIPAFKRKRSIAAQERKTTRVRRPRGEEPIKPVTRRKREVVREPAMPAGDRLMQTCGHCDGYFENINVAIIAVTKAIREGDIILMETVEGLFEQVISSMQKDKKEIKLARSGDSIGLKTTHKPKVGGQVYKVVHKI